MNISEILLVVVVALVVIKPEQLPGVAFKLGQWSKSLRKTLKQLRHEMDDTVQQLTQEVAPTKNDSQHDQS